MYVYILYMYGYTHTHVCMFNYRAGDCIGQQYKFLLHENKASFPSSNQSLQPSTATMNREYIHQSEDKARWT